MELSQSSKTNSISDGELRSENSSQEEYERRRDKKKKARRKERRRSSASSDGRSHKSDRERRHKRKHKRRQSSSNSRSRSRSSSRSRDRRRRRKSYRRSPSTDNSRDSDSYGRSNSAKSQTPNNTIMMRGIAPHLVENDIRQELLKGGIVVKDIRLIRQRETGTSRGFAFIEFHTVSEASKWMEATKGVFTIQNQYETNLIYSLSKGSEGNFGKPLADWYCSKCKAYNFKRRDLCYKCNEPKPPDEGTEYYSEISCNPTNTIMLYELDALTTEEGVLQAFQNSPVLASLPIRSVRVPREPGTMLSKRVCYVESNNVADSMKLFAIFTSESLEIDGVTVQAAYYRPNVARSQNPAAALALAAAQWTNSSGIPTSQPLTGDTEKMAEYSAALYAKNDAEYASYLEYYRNYYRSQAGQTTGTTSSKPQVAGAPSINTEIAVSGSVRSDERTEGEHVEAKPDEHQTPDPSRFSYDAASGYYFDSSSGLYYDPNTQYYYDPQTQQYLHWDEDKKQYIPNVSDDKSGKDTLEKHRKIEESKNMRGGKKPESKSAKTVAKEMEKWAKTLNNKKLEHTKPDEVNLLIGKWNKPLNETVVLPEIQEPKYEYEEPAKPVERETKIPQPVKISPTDPMFFDVQKLTCLLCKRQFSSYDTLMKHANMSDLHKQNFDEAVGGGDSNFSYLEQTTSKGYRDRAKERRMKFGSEASVSSNSLKELYMKVKEDLVSNYKEEPTVKGIKDDNIGNRMLQKMGWQEGQGLGKGSSGIVDPIRAERRFGKGGLGMDVPAGLEVDDSDDRQTKARKLTIARYMKLE